MENPAPVQSKENILLAVIATVILVAAGLFLIFQNQSSKIYKGSLTLEQLEKTGAPTAPVAPVKVKR